MKFFKKIYLEITNICNLNCTFCSKSKRPPLFMDMELFRTILTKLEGHTKHLYFHVLGEPLLHPKLGEFIQESHEKGYQVNITTNGTLLQESIYEKLLTEGLRQINISLHSWKDNNQFNRPQEFDKYLEQIIKFIEQAKLVKPGLFINLRLWNLKASKDLEENNGYVLKKLSQALALDFTISPEQLLAGNSITLRKNLFLSSDVEFIWPSLAAQYIGDTGYCYGLKNQLAILVDGSVIPCCLDGEGTIIFGNIKDSSLQEIIGSPRAQAIYQGFANRKVVEPLCQRCNFRTRF